MADDRFDVLTGDVFTLAELLDYQEGAIVSRTLIDREAATLTLFACDAGQTISEHTAPHAALVQLLDGRASVTVAETEYELAAGEALALPANVPHALAATEQFKMLLAMVR